MCKNPQHRAELVKALKQIEAERNCKAGLLKLHQMLLDGTDETEEADDICEEMCDYWRNMSEAGRRRINQLSIDLYVFSDQVFLERFDPCI